jgi:hypothetical protein
MRERVYGLLGTAAARGDGAAAETGEIIALVPLMRLIKPRVRKRVSWRDTEAGESLSRTGRRCARRMPAILKAGR